MVAPTKNAKPLAGVDPAIISTVAFFGERQASLAAASLQAIEAEAVRRGESQVNIQGLPVGFLLEVGAVAQLKAWELDGVAKLLPRDIPSYAKATEELFLRVQQNPRQFCETASATLSHQILRLWLEKFSWSAPALLGVDILVGNIDEDLLVDAVAQLLWKHRSDLRRCAEN